MAMILTEANDRQGFVSRFEAGALSAVAVLLHVALFWQLFQQPPVTSAEIPQMASASAENVVMVDLTAPSEAPAPSPAPVQPETESPLPEPAPPVTPVDDDAVQPEPEKKEVVKKTEPEPKPKPSAKIEHKARPVTHAAPSASPAVPSGQPQGTTANTAATTGAPAANNAGSSITPAVSGMQSLGNPPPDYPPLALRRQQQGSVTLRILVLENGHADSVTVIKSSQSELLDNAAIKTVGQWRFIPAKRGSQAIKGYAIQTITFTLPR
ncbi:energy transducer TonB [Sodalis ligni]|uniref:energy transducer TonB n=1 Tax=Sodalis ligni TaxID=2697027 RepID=UPI00193F3692|nr:energy transducer TonB [Sodalis ligni]QWA10395.1 energy transducer TonB [Sodalis ligni]